MTQRRVRWVFGLVVAALLLSSLSQRYLGHVMESPNLDFYDYYLAGQIVHADRHAPLYEGATDGNPQLKSAPVGTRLDVLAKQHGLDDIELYLYPPLLADMLAPVTRVPLMPAAGLWRLMNLGAVLVCAALLARMLGVDWLTFEFAVFVSLAYSFWPTHEAISLGQVAVLMLLLWTIGVTAYYDGRVGLSAAAFALATALKVTPLLVVPLFLIWRDKRWLGWYVSVSAALVAVMIAVNGWGNLLANIQVMQHMGGNVPALQNKGIGSVLAWLYYGKVFSLKDVHAVLDTPAKGLAMTSKVVSLGLYAGCLALVWRRRAELAGNRLAAATALAVFALVTAAISPVSWRHGYVVGIVPLAVLWVGALRTRVSMRHVVLLGLTTITLGSLVFDLAAQAGGPEVLKIVLGSTWTVFTLLLCLEVLWGGWERVPWAAAAEG